MWTDTSFFRETKLLFIRKLICWGEEFFRGSLHRWEFTHLTISRRWSRRRCRWSCRWSWGWRGRWRGRYTYTKQTVFVRETITLANTINVNLATVRDNSPVHSAVSTCKVTNSFDICGDCNLFCKQCFLNNMHLSKNDRQKKSRLCKKRHRGQTGAF